MSTAATTHGDGYAAGVKAEVAIARTRADVAHRQAEIEQHGLVTMPRGNVSARIASAQLMVMSPVSGPFEKVSPERTVVCDLDGRLVPDSLGSDRQPSLDAGIHAAVYRAHAEIGAIIHTDSPNALAWAEVAEILPCHTAGTAELLGDAVDVTVVDLASADAVPAAVARGCGAVAGIALVRGIGVFATGTTLRDAVARAVAVEAAARHALLVRHHQTPDAVS
ncbi:L-ribulose-5-phosphate 4-epimerase [Microbacterium sediminicola]|uniref:L-ribulose-5-phosphate 4-epimerase n=1 Tax=Microbacterium sediminicola TaxID=415210 RepID=A0ABN2I346_9MICO